MREERLKYGLVIFSQISDGRNDSIGIIGNSFTGCGKLNVLLICGEINSSDDLVGFFRSKLQSISKINLSYNFSSILPILGGHSTGVDHGISDSNNGQTNAILFFNMLKDFM